MTYSLGSLIYFVAITASVIAVFGPMGIWAVLAVTAGWYIVAWLLRKDATFAKTASTLAVGLLIAALITLLSPSSGHTPATVNQRQCLNNLRAIGTGILGYEADHGHFPPPYIADEAGKPMHSWRVLILPYVGGKAVYNQYNFDEPWNSPSNAKLLSAVPALYQHAEHSGAMCHYSAIVGGNSIWEPTTRISWNELSDGASRTLLVCESPRPVPWTKPQDLTPNEFLAAIQKNRRFGHDVFEQFFTGSATRMFGVCFSDGHVETFTTKLDPVAFRNVVSINDGAQLDKGNLTRSNGFRYVKWERVVGIAVLACLGAFSAIRVVWRRGDDKRDRS